MTSKYVDYKLIANEHHPRHRNFQVLRRFLGQTEAKWSYPEKEDHLPGIFLSLENHDIAIWQGQGD